MKKWVRKIDLFDAEYQAAKYHDNENKHKWTVVEVDVPDPPPPEPEVERCDVGDRNGHELFYRRAERFETALSRAVDDPDFIAYEYEGGESGEFPRLSHFPIWDKSPPATVPVAVLFRRQK